MITLAPLILIESSSSLQVTRTAIKFRLGSKFYQIRLRIAVFASLDRPINKSHRLIKEEML